MQAIGRQPQRLPEGTPVHYVTVKAPHVEAELNPPAVRQDWQGRWARPLDFSGESGAVGGRCGFGRGPLADQLELLDPARRVFLRTHGRVVDVLIEVGLLAREQHVDQADHLVSHRDRIAFLCDLRPCTFRGTKKPW